MPYGHKPRYHRRRTFRRHTRMPTRKAPKTVAIVAKKTHTAIRRRRPSNYKLTKPMRYLIDKRVNAHIEPITLRYSLYPVTTGAGYAAYTLRPEITDLSIVPVLPKIVQSHNTEDFAKQNGPVRMGNTICPKYLGITLTVFQDPSDTNQGVGAGDRGQIQPYILVGQMKDRKSFDAMSENSYDELVHTIWVAPDQFSTSDNIAPNVNSGEGHQFTGDRWQFLQGQLNKKSITPFFQRAPRLVRTVGYTSNPTPADGDAGWNCRYSGRTYKFRVPCPKHLKYVTNNDVYPCNFSPFCAIGFTYMNGAPPNEQAPLRCESSVKFVYTDVTH